ncbi:FHA domain-containing protein [Herpetosiphon geysericola]|uniref:FHA domain-containing protein n=1 Tax=Herpetosiphon geysericola TaxID=70996 RepID=A0A0P6YNI6_9CHLR|nr:FHA domain-containing protein [Herpetosiphon geysericola]KPL91864.1 hypothetical protein SE18_00435 [Herpetosiphon geysericola]
MGAKQARFELFIDVYEKKQQVAQTLTNIPTGELVESILKEFRRDFDFLGQNPDAYCLIKQDGSVLSNNRTLDKQVSNKERLIFSEAMPNMPEAGQPMARRIYLREHPSGNSYRLHWQPAIVGRFDNQASNDLLAVDLGSHPNGLRVSRRQFEITETGGHFYIESLSPNPTTITDSTGRPIQVDRRQVLQHGDLITLDRSQITFKVIISD